MAASGYGGFPMFRGLTPLPSSGRAGGLVEPEPITSHLDAAACPRKFNWIPSPRKLRGLYKHSNYQYSNIQKPTRCNSNNLL